MKFFLLLFFTVILSVSQGYSFSNNEEDYRRQIIETLVKESLGDEMKVDKRLSSEVLTIPMAALNGACKVKDKVHEIMEIKSDNSTKENVINTVCKVTKMVSGGLQKIFEDPLGAVCNAKKIVKSLLVLKNKHIQKRFWNLKKLFRKVKVKFNKLCQKYE